MRLALLLSLFAGPAWSWQFTIDPVCTIWNTAKSGEMIVTYDPRQLEPYTISVRLSYGTWSNTTGYQILFDGPNRFSIATNRHRLSDDGSTVIASDTGFGNVLSGLENNFVATALLGGRAVSVGLSGAADAVAKFRDCTLVGVS